MSKYKMTPEESIRNIKAVLSDDLLSRNYRYISELKNRDITTGHCYIASEALYHLIGGKKSGYSPRVARESDGETHWYLENKDGKKLDPTRSQYTKIGEEPPYAKGRGCGFLTRKPSKRASIIIQRIKLMRKK